MVPERSQARANPARGIALIATAVIVGIFLFRSGFDQPNAASADGGSGDPAAAGESSDGDAPAETTTTTPPPHNVAEVTVQVLNASGVSGAAGAHSDLLQQAGYQMAEPGNAPEGSDSAATFVYFAAGYQQDAPAVATALGAPATAVQPMPNPPPGTTNIVVILGTDVAG